MIKVPTRYLYWCKDIKESGKNVTTTYMSSKKARCCSSEVFAFHLIADINSLAEHTKNNNPVQANQGDQKACCWWVTEAHSCWLFRKWKALSSHKTRRSIISQDSSFYQCCSCLRVFKCHISYCTISDTKSHEAPTAWASLAQQSTCSVDLEAHLFISFLTVQLVSSATNTMHTWQKRTWVYTKSRHCKGPVDGVSFQSKQHNILCVRALGPIAKRPQANWCIWWGWCTTTQRDASTRPKDHNEILWNWISGQNSVFLSR